MTRSPLARPGRTLVRMARSMLVGVPLALGAAPEYAQAQTSSPVQVASAGENVMPGNRTPFDSAAFFRVFQHRTAVVSEGVHLHYVIGGMGEPVVLLHGWPTSWYEWRRIMPALIAAGHTVVAVDLRGLGDSDRPQSGYEKRTLAGDVYDLIRQLGFDHVLLVGHDWGTSTAFALAHEHPELVRRLVLTDNVIPGLPAGSRSWDDLNSHFWHHHFNAEPDLPEALATGRERLFLTWFYRKLTADWAAFPPDYLDEVTRVYSGLGGLRAGFSYYRALEADARQNRDYAKTKLPMPVLVVTARLTVADMLHEQLRPVVADYRGTIIEGCGHFLPIECPDQLLGQLLPFLDGGGDTKAVRP